MSSYLDLPFIEKVTTNQGEFGQKVIDIAGRLGIEPAWLMIVMNNESGLNPTAKNPLSTATGLIQFMANTAIGLGTTTTALAKMSNVQQLDYVEKYFNTYAGKIDNAADAYLAVFYPAAIGKPNDWQFPSLIVGVNKIFDLNKDGQLTKQEFNDYVNQKYAPYLAKDNDFTKIVKRKIFNQRTLPVFIGLTVLAIGGTIIALKSRR